MDLVRNSLDEYIGGMKAYGQVGYKGDVWKSKFDSSDSAPSLIISACYYIMDTKDNDWAKQNYNAVKDWAAGMIATDRNHDGIIEYGYSGNSNSWSKEDFKRPANWWDTIGFGHDDAYSNALAYKALTLLADGQTAISAQIGRPAGLAADPKGNVFVSDSDNACVWKIGTDGLITRVAGNFNLAYSGDGGLAVNAGFITPWGLALDNAGNLYIADENSRRIRKVSTTGIIQTVAGNGAAGFSGDGGPATMASLNSPQSVAVDANGNLYITDFANARIRKVSPDGIISTVAGNGSIGYAVDGVPATRSPLSLPFGLTLDPGGNLYFSDGLVHKVSPDGILTTIAGNLAIANQIGYSGDGGPATAAGLGPLGLAMGSNGNIYVAAGDGAVRMLQPVGPLAAANSASGATGSLAPGEIVTLYGSGIGPDQLVQATPGADGLYDPQLAGTVVTINGIAAPLLYAWTTQTAAIVPYGVTGPSAWATVTYNGMPAGTLTVPVAASAPGVFTADSSGQGQAAALNQDTTPNSPATPAKIGDTIVLFATGEGQTSPPGVDGKPATGTLPQPVLPVTVTIGGQTAHVVYAGAAPNEVAGVMQLNVQIPSGIQTGDAVPVILWVGYAASQSGVTVAIR